jgi:hypothetical protein
MMGSTEEFLIRKHPRIDDSITDDNSTDFKLALLASLHPGTDQSVLLEALVESDGAVHEAGKLLEDQSKRLKIEHSRKAPSLFPGRQASLASFNVTSHRAAAQESPKGLTKRGTTLRLYSPQDIDTYTPCSIIHNFLPSEEAEELLRELLAEAPTFKRQKFKLFDRVVESPHTAW